MTVKALFDAIDAMPAYKRVADRIGLDLPLAGLVDGKIILGVRPEDIAVSTATPGQKPSGFSIFETEPLGAFSIVDIIAGDTILKAQVRGHAKFPLGQAVSLHVDPSHCHAFDPINGANLLLDGQH